MTRNKDFFDHCNASARLKIAEQAMSGDLELEEVRNQMAPGVNEKQVKASAVARRHNLLYREESTVMINGSVTFKIRSVYDRLPIWC